jgi:hypothetical protein
MMDRRPKLRRVMGLWLVEYQMGVDEDWLRKAIIYAGDRNYAEKCKKKLDLRFNERRHG